MQNKNLLTPTTQNFIRIFLDNIYDFKISSYYQKMAEW